MDIIEELRPIYDFYESISLTAAQDLFEAGFLDAGDMKWNYRGQSYLRGENYEIYYVGRLVKSVNYYTKQTKEILVDGILYDKPLSEHCCGGYITKNHKKAYFEAHGGIFIM